MRVPDPDFESFVSSRDGGYLVFINMSALVFQIRVSADLLEDEEMVDPIGRFDADKLSVFVQPGLPCPVSSGDRSWLLKSFKRRSKHITDPQKYNMGYLPSKDGEEKLPVLIDMDAVEALSGNVQSSLDDDAYHARLERIKAAQAVFDPLRELFLEIFSASGNTDLAAKAFWALCGKMKDAGQLNASWLTTDNVSKTGHKGVHKSSMSYERCVERSNYRLR